MALSASIHYDITRMIGNWEPPARPACSNCSNCRVYGNADRPLVYCKAGHDEGGDGRKVEMGRLIRSTRPIGFKSAERCPDYDSMDDQKQGRK